MFSSALKSFTSNISANYTLAVNPTSISGPWKIYDAKKKTTGKAVSVFVFDKRTLDPQSGGLGGRNNASSLKRAHDGVLERLKKEASSLARLRHPSVLELAEPVEETRNGGLMFATEPVTASLAGLLQEKDDQEKAGGVGGRPSRYVIEEADGSGRRRREVEIDELEIQKGLLQVAKGLEFLHESAGLLHGNLTPDAIYINAKSDWKISGLGFSSPPEISSTTTSVVPISLAEVLHHDPRLPRSVQLNLDYTSPDFVLDGNVTQSADMFSLGLLIVALYNSPHQSPLQTFSNPSTYKKFFNSSSLTPTQSNDFLSARPLPKELTSVILPRLITRRPAGRLDAREFQQSQYFDNILVSTIRFLDSLPAKTPNEKAQFMRGLPRILSQFPKSILDRKVLPALLEEMKDRELLSLILQNVFKIVTMMPSGRRAFTEKVTPKLREVFLSGSGATTAKGSAMERDNGKEAGLMVVLDNMTAIVKNCSGKEFKDDILPMIHLAMESPINTLVDTSLRSLPLVLPALDFSTIKNDLFPVVANVVSKTNSLGIKVRGLEALATLCGASPAESSDDFDGVNIEGQIKSKSTANTALDKFTIQEKVVPLLKAIKTKEPKVMMAALSVFQQVGKTADSDFLAMDVLPILWSFSLGPLLDLSQFASFMALIKSLSSKIEQDQTRKLKELSSNPSANIENTQNNDFMTFGVINSANTNDGFADGGDGDFERLVLGKRTGNAQSGDMLSGGWDNGVSTKPPNASSQSQPDRSPAAPVFSWSTPSSTGPSASSNTLSSMSSVLSPQQAPSRTITPDHNLGQFATLAPSNSSAFSPPMQPQTNTFNWSATTATFNPPNPWSATRTTSNPSLATLSISQQKQPPSHLPPPPLTSTNSSSAFTLPPTPLTSHHSFHSSSQPPPQYQQHPGTASTPFNAFGIAPSPVQRTPAGKAPQLPYGPSWGAGFVSDASGQGRGGQGPGQGQKKGLDAYESLL
ncbi:MAG: hypothetical protein M1827_006456 [Pycnora praestabilis]|nr:MAG: hypothetical protein M1827_006456 [Pycnora praestabilis]